MEITHVGFSQVNFKKTPPFIEKKDVIDERGFVNVRTADKDKLIVSAYPLKPELK